MITVTVCVGSSCHIKGARRMIVSFRVVEFDTTPIILLRKRGIEATIETV